MPWQNERCSGQGRTVLFVSHNMPSIRLLCNKCLFLENGYVKNIGDADTIIGEYFSCGINLLTDNPSEIPNTLSTYNTGEAKFKRASVLSSNKKETNELDFLEKFYVNMRLDVFKHLNDVALSVYIVNQYGDRILMAVENELYKPISFLEGQHNIEVMFEEELMPGNYSIGFSISYFHTGSSIDYVESFYPFSVKKESREKNMEYPWATVHGYVRPKTKWKINTL